ncbi:MAG TPA: glycosyl transferase [Burkholderiaceae bacterium]|nr:glycosyl transferase [Burkholderiaceae bacterium]
MHLVYFSPVALSSFWQRPHWMATTLLRKGIERILWVEPYPTRLPKLVDLRRPSDQPDANRRLPLAIDRLAVRALPVEPWLIGQAINRLLFFEGVLDRIRRWVDARPFVIGVGKPSPLARLAIERSMPDRNYCGSFFDAMDHYASFYEGVSRAAMAQWEANIVVAVDRVQVSSAALRERYRRLRADIALVPNGCDTAAVQQAIAHCTALGTGQSAPVYGYLGTLGTWFDWAWLNRFARVLARVAPQAQIHLIGPMFSEPNAPVPPQVRLLGTMSNDDALARAASFAAGLIPFVSNELTDCVDPVKYYEYRALGRPVIAAPFSDLAARQDPGLFVASTEADFEAVLDRLSSAETRVPALHHWAWDHRFASLANWIRDQQRTELCESSLAGAAAN